MDYRDQHPALDAPPAPHKRRTLGDFYRHLAEHDGRLPARLDAAARCVTCIGLGWFKLDA